MLRFDMNFLYTMINLIVLAFLLKKFLIKRIIMKFIKNMLMNIIVLLQWVFIIYNMLMIQA